MNKNKQKIFKFTKTMYLQHEEKIKYLIFGGFTTVVNFIVYFIVNNIFKIEELTSNVIAWIISVLFAYVTNKIIVFKSTTTDKKKIFKEIIGFFSARVFTLVLCDILLFVLMVNVMNINSYIVKLILQVVVIILNYIFSKIFIFKK